MSIKRLTAINGGGDPIVRQASAWFARLRADDVNENERRRWRDWLESDPRHRAAYERFERLWSGFGAHAPCPEIESRIRAGASVLKPSHSRSKPPARSWTDMMAGIAATILVAVGVVGWLSTLDDVPELHYATAIGEQRTVLLEDGSRISLDTDTRLHVRFSDDERSIVLEQGRAFFRVAKERRPLAVYASDRKIRAVGTAFDVYRRQGGVEIMLVEGKVLLFPHSGATQDTPIPMIAGQRARFVAKRLNPVIETAGAHQTPPWLSGKLIFNDAPLPAVLAEFNRYNSHPVVLGDADLARIRISGVFRSDDPQAFLNALRDIYALSVMPAPDGDLVITSSR